MPSKTSQRSALGRAVLGLSCVILSACGQAAPPAAQVDAGVDALPPGISCDFDESIGLDTAASLQLGETRTGRICPVQDQDWYRFNTGTDVRVDVTLQMAGEFSAVVPSYAIVAPDGTAVAQGSSRAGVAQGRHCVMPGEYVMVVRDATDAHQDLRNDYELTVETGAEPDSLEPNNTPETATGIAPNGPKSGLIACAGDEDWYRFQVDARYILSVGVQMEIADFQPKVEIVSPSGLTILQLANGASGRLETALTETIALEEIGEYYLKVTDNDGRDTDLDTAYTLTIKLEEDLDANEPNDEPVDATEIASQVCGADWGEWVELEGTFGTNGDVDLFRLPLTGCTPGLIEAEVIFDTDGLTEQQTDSIQAAIAMLRVHQPSPCAAHEECRELNLACEDPWACAGFGHNCGPNRRCAGVGTCLAEERCAGLQVQRHFQPDAARDPSEDPPPHRAALSAPIFGDDLLYLRVSDFGGDGFAANNFYRLRVRTRAEPDIHEPSNVYINSLMRSGQPTGINLNLARTRNVVPVHLCGVRPSDPCVEMQPQCNNQLDDDGDQRTDWPEDPGCTSPTDETEQDPDRVLPCSNAIDDDGDGLVDYPEDPDCVSASWRREEDPICPPGLAIQRIGREQDVVQGTVGQTSELAGTCGGRGGQETVYALTLSYPSEVTFRLDAQFEGVVYALWDCNDGAEELGCGPSGQDVTINFETPGVFMIVVDTLDGPGDFTLSVDRSPPPAACDDPDGDQGGAGGAPGQGDGGGGDGGSGGVPIGGIGAGGEAGNAGTAGAAGAGGAAGNGGAAGAGGAAGNGGAAGAGGAAGNGGAAGAAGAGGAAGNGGAGGEAGNGGAGGQLNLDAGLDAGSLPNLDAGVAAADSGAVGDSATDADAGMSLADGGPDAVAPPPPDMIPHCCGTEDSDWIEGVLSYEYDQDYYAYAHPCPGEDCMVRIVFQIDEGPVDHHWQVYAGNSPWFDQIVPVTEAPHHGAVAGTFGGLENSDQCFYAFQGHEQPYYVLSIRDFLPVPDASADQRYRFCIEKVADGCHEPPCKRNPVTNAAGDVLREECSAR